MHVASFAGFAPVNNPAIAVAVVVDNPKGDYYGASVSAPVFAEVAQQVLEYLGVSHDIDLQPVKNGAAKKTPVHEDEGAAQGEDIQALYEAANNLPGDDPQAPAPAQNPGGKTGAPADAKTSGGAKPTAPAVAQARQEAPAQGPGLTNSAQAAPAAGGKTVTLSEARQIQVPQLIGLPMRSAIEVAAAAGFEVQIAGSGTAREQAPAAGTMVNAGTKIAVKCAR
jgi:cell division protein FtsI (penicillin-binding protein 3)